MTTVVPWNYILQEITSISVRDTSTFIFQLGGFGQPI